MLRHLQHQSTFQKLKHIVTFLVCSAPNPHKGGNTIELPPWKKGWHRPMAPQYARRHFMQQQGAAQVCGPTLCSAAPWIEIFLQ